MKTPDEIVRIVAPMWDQEIKPTLAPNACIAAARTLAGVFDYFDVDYSVVPVNVTAANEGAFISMGVLHPDDWPTAAWTIGISPTHKGEGWNGHVVVITADEPRIYIDLDARQFDRLAKGIVTDGPLIRRLDEFDLVQRETEGLEQYSFGMLHVALTKGHYLWTPDFENEDFLEAKDWNRPYEPVIGEMIRRCKGRNPRRVQRIA